MCNTTLFLLQALHEQLESKEIEIESIKQLGTTLMEIEDDMPPPSGGTSVSDTCDELNQQWADLDHRVKLLHSVQCIRCFAMKVKSWKLSKIYIYKYLQVYQLEGSLDDALKQWNSYHSVLQKVTQILTETEYALHRYSTATGDIHAFTDQIKQLKVRPF